MSSLYLLQCATAQLAPTMLIIRATMSRAPIMTFVPCLCGAMGLFVLGKLHNLKRLTLVLRGLKLTAAEAKGLVYSLYCIPKVQVTVGSVQQKHILTTAVQQAITNGIAVTGGFRVEVKDTAQDWP